MILGEQDTPIAHLCWDHTDEAAPTLADLEYWRDQLAARLERVVREPSPYVCEGFEFGHWRLCSVVKGRLVDSLLKQIDALNDRIRTLIMPEAA